MGMTRAELEERVDELEAGLEQILQELASGEPDVAVVEVLVNRLLHDEEDDEGEND